MKRVVKLVTSALVAAVLTACGFEVTRADQKADFNNDLKVLGYSDYTAPVWDNEDDRGMNTSALETVIEVNIGGCRYEVELEREEYETEVAHTVGDHNIEVFDVDEINIGSNEYQGDISSPTPEGLEDYLKEKVPC